MSTKEKSIEILSSLSGVGPGYDAWFCDIWGVIHNGVRAFERAHRACSAFREQGGHVVLLTNSPRPSDAVTQQLLEIGVPEAAFDTVVSSGDVARSLVASRPGRPIYHLGPERDRGVFDGLDVVLCEPAEAEIVLCSGLFDDETETPDDYEPLLTELMARSLPMICSNPDIVVERGDSIIYCAGALAERYKSLGGDVIYTGKPHSAIYDLGFKTLADLSGREIPRNKILAIGDGMKTDMPGAFAAKLDAVFVASGIHVDGHNETAALSSAAVQGLFSELDQMPIAAMARLEW